MVPPRPPSESGEGRIVAVVGSRDFKPISDVDAWIGRLARKHPSATVVSGGARGVDRQAERAARARGLQVISFQPAEGSNGRFSIQKNGSDLGRSFKSFGAAAKHRNGLIVAECDHLVAFWDGSSRGTLDAMRRARKAGKLALVIPAESDFLANLILTFDAKEIRPLFAGKYRRQ